MDIIVLLFSYAVRSRVLSKLFLKFSFMLKHVTLNSYLHRVRVSFVIFIWQSVSAQEQLNVAVCFKRYFICSISSTARMILMILKLKSNEHDKCFVFGTHVDILDVYDATLSHGLVLKQQTNIAIHY